jgi:retron-type reverse transcriptase
MSETKPFSISRRLVSLAYQKVRSNKGAGGVDGVRLEEFHAGYKDHLYRLWNRMSSGSWAVGDQGTVLCAGKMLEAELGGGPGYQRLL